MKKILVMLVLVFSVFFVVGCNKPVEIEGLIAQGKLYVGTSTDYAPYEFLDLTKEGDEQYVGADIELAKAIADEYNLEIVFKVMSFDTVLSALDTNKIDVAISGFTYDEDRAASYLFSESYYDDGEGDQVLVYNKSKADQFKSLEDLNKPEVKVGAQNGSLQQSLVEDQLPNCNLIAFEDINNAFTALNSGQYDAIAIASTAADTILTADVNKDLMKSEFKFEVEDSALYVIMKKGNTDLKAKVDVVCKESATSLYETWIKNAEALYQSLGDNAGELIPEEEEDEIQ